MAEQTKVVAVRGAVQAEENSAESILAATGKLMHELMEMNELAPDEMISAIFTTTPDLDAEFPAVAARGDGPRRGAADVRAGDPGSGRDATGDPGHGPLQPSRSTGTPGTSTSARPAACGPTSTRPSRPAGGSEMSAKFNDRLASIPGYTPGVPKGQTAEDVAGSDLAQLASNESPHPPLPEVVEAIGEAATSMNRYPDPDATRLRGRLAELHGVGPERIAVSNGSCEILLAAAEAMLEPGAAVVYAWPAFSMYPNLAAMSGADEVRVPLGDGEVHDLDAMLAAITPETRLVMVCNPNNPTATYLPASEVASFVEAGCRKTSP